MKRVLLVIVLLISATQLLKAQQPDKVVYPMVVSFQSICCGVPSDTAIRKFVSSFKKKYKIKKITAMHIGPMGKEGEYYLAFNLKELTKKQSKDFISRIQKVEKLSSDPGVFSFHEKREIVRSEIYPRAKWTKTVF